MKSPNRWVRDNEVSPPVFKYGVLRFQAVGPVLAAAAFVWSSLGVRLALGETYLLDLDHPAGWVALYGFLFALLIALVEVASWLRAGLPARWGGGNLKVSLAESACVAGLAATCALSGGYI